MFGYVDIAWLPNLNFIIGLVAIASTAFLIICRIKKRQEVDKLQELFYVRHFGAKEKWLRIKGLLDWILEFKGVSGELLDQQTYEDMWQILDKQSDDLVSTAEDIKDLADIVRSTDDLKVVQDSLEELEEQILDLNDMLELCEDLYEQMADSLDSSALD